MNNLMLINIIDRVDYDFAKWAHEFYRGAGDFVSGFLKLVTLLGNGGMVFIVIAFVMLLFKKTRVTGLMALVSLLIGALLTNVLLKNIIARPRPFLDQNSDYYLWWLEAGALAQDGYAFPSGHATAAMAFSFPLFLMFKKKWSPLILFVPLLMGYTRIYFMVHFTSDVVIGLLIGIIAGVGSYFIVIALLKIPLVKKGEELPSIVAFFKNKNKDA